MIDFSEIRNIAELNEAIAANHEVLAAKETELSGRAKSVKKAYTPVKFLAEGVKLLFSAIPFGQVILPLLLGSKLRLFKRK